MQIQTLGGSLQSVGTTHVLLPWCWLIHVVLASSASAVFAHRRMTHRRMTSEARKSLGGRRIFARQTEKACCRDEKNMGESRSRWEREQAKTEVEINISLHVSGKLERRGPKLAIYPLSIAFIRSSRGSTGSTKNIIMRWPSASTNKDKVRRALFLTNNLSDKIPPRWLQKDLYIW